MNPRFTFFYSKFLVLASALLRLATPNSAEAQFTYTTNNGGITITGYTGAGSSVSIPGTTNGLPVTEIGDWAFYSLTNVSSVVIRDGPIEIGNFAFFDCYNLTNVTIPSSVTSIGRRGFEGCGLSAITIPGSVTNLGDLAFAGCYALTSVTIPASVMSIGYQEFSGCTSLRAIAVDPANPVYSSVDGVLFDKNQTTLIEYPPGKANSYMIPNGVMTIGNHAFLVCSILTSITIASSVTNIEAGAFNECNNLRSAYFEGDSPVAHDAFTFIDHAMLFSDPAVIYYLHGTVGWSSTFDRLPTALWTPELSTGGASFGVQTNGFSFDISWARDATVVVEACTNLSYLVWTPVATNILSSGTSHFIYNDPQWTNYPARFYRLKQK